VVLKFLSYAQIALLNLFKIFPKSPNIFKPPRRYKDRGLINMIAHNAKGEDICMHYNTMV
jgi:hypothetical protein